jgi:hypothetical protein
MGIVGLTFSCANALAAYGVTANCIAPVAVTRMTESLGKRGSFDYSPENEQLSARNVVPAVVYVASERSSWLNRRIIAAGNGRISLHSNFDIQADLQAEGEPAIWTNEAAAEAIERDFKGQPEQMNPFAAKAGP